MEFDLKTGLVVIGIALLPVYAFPSGGVQPAHLLLGLLATLYLLEWRWPRDQWAQSFGLLVCFVFAVESVYVIDGGDPRYLINAAYFAFNCIVATAIVLYCDDEGPEGVVRGVMIASAVTLVTIVTQGFDLQTFSEPGRLTGSFNNPNQLGFFSVCLLAMTFSFYRKKLVGYHVALALFTTSLLVSILSLSKAAMVSNFAVIGLAAAPRLSKKHVVAIFTVIAVFIGSTISNIGVPMLEELTFVSRLAGMLGEQDSSLASRGYLAFLEGNTLQWVFGLGAENVQNIIGHEVHSTLGSVFTEYGLVGAGLFGSVLVLWILRIVRGYGPIGVVCIVTPPMLYGLTHNGTRFTIFWILFGVSLSLANRAEGHTLANDRRGAIDKTPRTG